MVEEGSGEFTYSMLSSRSEGSVTEDGEYTAGDHWVDVIRASDVQTAEYTDIELTVVESVNLVPQPRWCFFPSARRLRYVSCGTETSSRGRR